MLVIENCDDAPIVIPGCYDLHDEIAVQCVGRQIVGALPMKSLALVGCIYREEANPMNTGPARDGNVHGVAVNDVGHTDSQ